MVLLNEDLGLCVLDERLHRTHNGWQDKCRTWTCCCLAHSSHRNRTEIACVPSNWADFAVLFRCNSWYSITMCFAQVLVKLLKWGLASNLSRFWATKVNICILLHSDYSTWHVLLVQNCILPAVLSDKRDILCSTVWMIVTQITCQACNNRVSPMHRVAMCGIAFSFGMRECVGCVCVKYICDTHVNLYLGTPILFKWSTFHRQFERAIEPLIIMYNTIHDVANYCNFT